MKCNIRILSILMVILMTFTLTGCPATMPSGPLPSTGSTPITTAPTGTTAMQYDEAYITALATRCLYDENGVQHLCIDEEKRKRLEIKLITKILDFEIVKAA